MKVGTGASSDAHTGSSGRTKDLETKEVSTTTMSRSKIDSSESHSTPQSGDKAS